MKAFNLEEAQKGVQVVTRSGRKARVICSDAKGKYPLIVLIKNDENEEDLISVTKDGRFYNNDDKQSDLDLFMYEEQKFDLEKAIKNGCKTKNGDKVEILKDFRTSNKDYTVAAIIHYKDFDSFELYTIDGKYDKYSKLSEDLVNL